MKLDFFKKQGGQTSIEIALVTGAIFIIVVSVIPYIGDANITNKAVAAARDGVTFSETMLNMGYTGTDEFGTPVELPSGETIRVEDISSTTIKTDLGNGETKTDICISLTFSTTITDPVEAQQAQQLIVGQSKDYIHYAFAGNWDRGPLSWVEINNNLWIHVYPSSNPTWACP